ncbi:glycosyltransferase [Desulfuromonas acetexigens]|uniref:Glycosyltransferase n=1 Tax=Trichloromonas acetexigens TaxID=38815 RepID=A0A550JJG6_9BACT|nr:glycosyltransferase [Desulfuromonas acetexigens]TRO83366.1 glycosyltransferase [Desulfuromonas acetexigens]
MLRPYMAETVKRHRCAPVIPNHEDFALSSRPIHIMHVLGNFGMGGAEMGVARLVQGLSGEEMRHSLAILGADRSLLDELRLELPCHALGIRGRSYMAFRPLAELFRRERVDIVHVNNLAPWPDAALAAKLAGCRCVETFHGVEQGLIQFSLPRKLFLRGVFRLSARVTAVADEAAELLTTLTGIPRAAVDVIANGIDTERFAPVASPEARRALRRDKGLPEEGLLLGCVAALRPVKNHRGLLRAFAQAVTGTAAAAHLVLVGDGELAGELRELAETLGIAERVLFLGRRADVAELLPCFDAFVLNSDTEGLSYAVLEAMACGLPLIATAVGGNVRLVRDGRQGLLVPVGDGDALAAALARVLAEPDSLAAMGREARIMVDTEYGMTAMLARYHNLYRELAG